MIMIFQPMNEIISIHKTNPLTVPKHLPKANPKTFPEPFPIMSVLTLTNPIYYFLFL